MVRLRNSLKVASVYLQLASPLRFAHHSIRYRVLASVASFAERAVCFYVIVFPASVIDGRYFCTTLWNFQRFCLCESPKKQKNHKQKFKQEWIGRIAFHPTKTVNSSIGGFRFASCVNVCVRMWQTSFVVISHWATKLIIENRKSAFLHENVIAEDTRKKKHPQI